MRCDDVTEKFDRYLEGQLRVTERLMVDVHVAQCYFCREALAERRALDALVSSVIRHPDPKDGYATLAARIRRDETRAEPLRPSRFRFHEVRWRMVFASAALLIVGASASWMGATSFRSGNSRAGETTLDEPALIESLTERNKQLDAEENALDSRGRSITNDSVNESLRRDE